MGLQTESRLTYLVYTKGEYRKRKIIYYFTMSIVKKTRELKQLIENNHVSQHGRVLYMIITIICLSP